MTALVKNFFGFTPVKVRTAFSHLWVCAFGQICEAWAVISWTPFPPRAFLLSSDILMTRTLDLSVAAPRVCKPLLVFPGCFLCFFFFFVLGQFSWSFLKRTDLMLLCPRLRRPSNFIFSYQLIFQFYELHLVNLYCFCFYGQDVQFLPICFKRMYNWSLKHFCDDRFEILVR